MRRLILAAVVGVAFVGVLACGGSDFNDPTSHGSGSVTGLSGFTAKSAYAIAKVNSDGSKDLSKVEFLVIGDDWTCADLRGSSGPPSSGGVQAVIGADGGVVPGDYSLSGTGTMVVYPPGADFSGSLFGADGTITVSAIDANTLQGSFDVTTVDGDGGTLNLTGNFNAPFCEVPQAFQQ